MMRRPSRTTALLVAVTVVLLFSLVLLWLSGRARVADILIVGVVLCVGSGLWLQARRRALVERRAAGRLARQLQADMRSTERALDRSIRSALRGAESDKSAALSDVLAVAANTEQHAVVLQTHLDHVSEGIHEIDRVLRQVHYRTGNEASATERRRIANQIQALLHLSSRTTVDLPLLGGWALSPDALLLTLSVLESTRPRTIVELGSGASTLHLALLRSRIELDCRHVALDHDPTFADATRRALDRRGLLEAVDVRTAPLMDLEVDGERVPWYERAAVEDLHDIDLLLVDGPPGAAHPLSRYPALEVLKDRLSSRCVVILDDAVREQETEVLRRWMVEQPEWQRLPIDTEKGTAVLYRGAPPL